MMEFVTLTEKEYKKFWENHPLKTFISSVEIATMRKKSGREVYYVGIKDSKKIIAGTMLTARIKQFRKKEFYAPRGLLLDYNNEELLTFFTKELKKFIKEKNGYVLRIDPYVVYKERDIDGNIIEGGIDNTHVVENLRKLGYIPLEEKDFEQVSWMFALDLEGKTKDEIMKEMKPNTRNTIRKAMKFGIEIKELSYDELPRFLSIMEETGERKNFSIRDLSYFQNMYDLFSKNGEIKYLVTELNLKKYIKKLEVEIKEKEDKLNSLSDAKYNDGQKKSLTSEIESLNKRILDSKKIREKSKKDVITLSGSMFVMTKPEIIYLSSGNYMEYMHFNSQYLIQWEMIQYGIDNGYKRYNFYGIPANINQRPKDYGIYEFKRGFNGYVEQLIGEYALPINCYYHVFNVILKIKKLIRR